MERTESRQIMVRNNITEVAYNVQSTVDAKHNIPIDYKVTNENDSKAMGDMVRTYGSIKRQWGFNYILPKKGIARAGSDVGFMFIAYNLRRIGNILTIDVMKEYLKAIASLYFDILGLFRGISVTCNGIFIHGIQMPVRNSLSL